MSFLFFFRVFKISFLCFIVFHLWEKRNPWHWVAWDGGMYSKGGLRICVGNGATRERPSLYGREDRNRIAIYDLAILDDRLYTIYN